MRFSGGVGRKRSESKRGENRRRKELPEKSSRDVRQKRRKNRNWCVSLPVMSVDSMHYLILVILILTL